MQGYELDPANPPHEALRGFPLLIAIPVQWADMDSIGHVNNILYLRWSETARVLYLKRIGMWDRMESEGVGPILAAVSCDFLHQVEFPDTIYIGARVTRIGNSSMRMEHRLVSRASGEVAAEAGSTLVFYDYGEKKPLRVPEHVRQAVARLEGRPVSD